MKKTRIIIASVLAAVMSLSGVAENGIATKFVSAAKKPAIAKKISVNVGDTVSIKVKYAGKKTKVK